MMSTVSLLTFFIEYGTEMFMHVSENLRVWLTTHMKTNVYTPRASTYEEEERTLLEPRTSEKGTSTWSSGVSKDRNLKPPPLKTRGFKLLVHGLVFGLIRASVSRTLIPWYVCVHLWVWFKFNCDGKPVCMYTSFVPRWAFSLSHIYTVEKKYAKNEEGEGLTLSTNLNFAQHGEAWGRG